MSVALRFADGRPAHAQLSARNVKVNDVTSGRIASLVRVELIANQSGRISVEASAISYPVAPVPGLGRKTARLSFKAQVKGGVPLGHDADAMARWRDDGGTLEISQMIINHGPLELNGDGTVALDRSLQPIGAFSLRVRGIIEAVDRLEEAGLIKPRAASLTKSVLSAMAGSKWDGGGGDIKVPLSIQDNKLYLGPVAVAKVPVVRWPSGK
jgi:hypothetical protein